MPQIMGGVEEVNDGAWQRVWLELASNEALTKLFIALPEDPPWTFTPGQDGVLPGRGRIACFEERLIQGRRVAWRVDLHDVRGVTARANVTCSRGRTSWVVPVDLTVAPDVILF